MKNEDRSAINLLSLALPSFQEFHHTLQMYLAALLMCVNIFLYTGILLIRIKYGIIRNHYGGQMKARVKALLSECMNQDW